jgi:hypothetical protein
MQFWVKLIETVVDLSKEEKEELIANCTFIKNNVWIFEGDIEFLDVRSRILDEGAVGCLGGLLQEELIEICKSTFNFDETLLD